MADVSEKLMPPYGHGPQERGFVSKPPQQNVAAGASTAPATASSDEPRRVDVSVVVPMYNEANQATGFLTRLSQALKHNGYDYEIVAVDDGSTDETPDVIGAVAVSDPRVVLVRLPRNAGQHHATLVGMGAARGAIVITMDADVRIEADQLQRLIEDLKIDPQCDVTSAIRDDRSVGLLRRPASYAVSFLTNFVCRTRLQDPGSTLKAMRSAVVDRALQNAILAQNLPMFLAYAGFRIREVDLGLIAQEGRASRYRVTSLVMTLALAMLNYSSGARALTWLLVAGGGMAMAGLALCGGIVLNGMIRQTALPTNMLLAGLLAIVLGGQFMALSMLGYKLEALMRNLKLRGMPMQFPGNEASFAGRPATADASAHLVPMTAGKRSPSR